MPEPLAPNAVRFDERGLVVVIAQHALTGEVRMVAYANEEALERTKQTNLAYFFSRSRGKLWCKGEESGNTLKVLSIASDCDNDALIYRVLPNGPSCHTGAESCFSNEGQARIPFLVELEATLRDRAHASDSRSYTSSLLAKGSHHIGDKLREEADELAVALSDESLERVVSESADVLYHMQVALLARGLSLEQVLAELQRRFGTSGIDEKALRSAAK